MFSRLPPSFLLKRSLSWEKVGHLYQRQRFLTFGYEMVDLLSLKFGRTQICYDVEFSLMISSLYFILATDAAFFGVRLK